MRISRVPGFTFVELVLSVTLMAAVFVAMVQIHLMLIGQYDRTQLTVETIQNMVLAQRRIEYAIGKASGVDGSTTFADLVTPGNQLALNIPGESDTIFTVNGSGQLLVSIDGNAAEPITTEAVTITSLVLTDRTDGNDRNPYISASFVIEPTSTSSTIPDLVFEGGGLIRTHQ